MSLHALKEPITLVSRCRGPPSPSKVVNVSPRRRQCSTSKLLAALDALEVGDTKDDSSIEIVGPVASVEKPKAKSIESKPIHPFFTSAAASTSTLKFKEDAKRVEATSIKTHKSKSRSKEHDAQLENLPNYSYKAFKPAPTTVYIRHEEEANDLVQTLRGPLGFDMEWRVAFRGPERRTALVQLCDESLILLIQHVILMRIEEFPQKVKEVIESKDIVKMGVNIANDARKLFRDFGISASSLVELGAFAQHADPSFAITCHRVFNCQIQRNIISLDKVVRMYIGRRLLKGPARMGNWEAELGSVQIDYAANDVHSGLIVYKRIMFLASKAVPRKTLEPKLYTIHMANDNTNKTPNSTLSSQSTTTLPTTSRSSGRIAMAPPDTDISLTSSTSSPTPQQMRAYNLWHHKQMPLETICATLRSTENPLKESTVISYVILALQADSSLPFNMARLKELVQMEAGSWKRHCWWIMKAEAKGRGS